ncbi:hypothetical protein AcW2_001144 [Taiwanofungus camphoratus]|nr:hypothetical protein AcW2_001144 [Antrodia cinnamomea]
MDDLLITNIHGTLNSQLKTYTDGTTEEAKRMDVYVLCTFMDGPLECSREGHYCFPQRKATIRIAGNAVADLHF